MQWMEEAGGAGRTDYVVPVGFIVNVTMCNKVNVQTYLQLCDVDVWVP